MLRIGRSRSADPLFLDWLRQQVEWACIITGRVYEAECAHIRSRGAGGSDRWVMPLIPEQHRESHAHPEWWYRNRVAIAEWCAGLPALWVRYETERADRMIRS